MKFKIDELDRLAKEYGYHNGYYLLMDLGYGYKVCHLLYNGRRLGYEVAFKLCRYFCVDKACNVIKFGKHESKDGLIAKYYKG